MSWRRRLAVGVLGLLLVGGVGFGLYSLFEAGGTNSVWPEVVSATATLALVVVTGGYVWLTYRLVRIQSDPGLVVRAQMREDAVASIAIAINKASTSISIVAHEYPLKDLKAFPGPLFSDHLQRIGRLEEVLVEKETFLPPSLLGEVISLHHELLLGDNLVLRLSNAIGAEKARAKGAGEEWTVEGARHAYYDIIRELYPERRPEWDDLLNGEPYRRAEIIATRLAEAISQGYIIT